MRLIRCFHPLHVKDGVLIAIPFIDWSTTFVPHHANLLEYGVVSTLQVFTTPRGESEAESQKSQDWSVMLHGAFDTPSRTSVKCMKCVLAKS